MEIKGSSFYSCTSLSTVELKSGLTSIGTLSFFQAGITTLKLPRTLESIGENAFSNSKLQIITFEENAEISVLGTMSFKDCESLSEFIFPLSLTQIGRFAFQNTALKNVTIPTSINSLEEGCFKGCKQLVLFTIPENSNLLSCGYGIFEDCTNFKEIVSHEGNNFIVENYGLFNKDRTQLVVLPPASPVTIFYIPHIMKTIRQKALYGCKNLNAVVIPDKSVESIEAHAFENSVNLDRINLPNSIKSVGLDAFKNCRNLKCGVIVNTNNKTFISNLYYIGKMKKSAFIQCNYIKTCSHNQIIQRICQLSLYIVLVF